MNKQASSSRSQHKTMALVLGLIGCCCSVNLFALPEDATKGVEIDSGGFELIQENGLSIQLLTGTTEEPVVITQGTMKISGLEVRIETKNEVILRIIAKGKPAHFQQQLEQNEAPLLARGRQLVFDNATKQLAIDEDAQLEQKGSTMTAHHFDYDLNTRNFKADKSPDGERIKIVIPPSPQQ